MTLPDSVPTYPDLTHADGGDPSLRLGDTHDRFPIAGIGASAGGLAPTLELIGQLGPDPGVALVVIHHLDSAHPSNLVEILGRATSMPVEAATNGRRVEPNHVYVIPSNTGLLIGGGLLELTPRIEEGGLHLPIDRFFEALARDQYSRAVGVVLSGSGADGSLGVQAIKAAGGTTFAEDASAEHASMPESAVATGCVDFVLSPAAIAQELLRLGAQPPASVASGEVPAEDEAHWQRIVLLLRKASGIDFSNYKQTTLRRRVQRRVSLRRAQSLREYVDLLERDPAEVSALAEEVLIHVTSFFRDPELFETLRERVLPKLLARRSPAAPIRIWIPGCSTGEEVYSIAITLLEYLASASTTTFPIQLFGTDVSPRAIERARSGKYPEGIAQDVSLARLQTFFTRAGSTYQIRKDVRDACVFARQDATRDPPFSDVDIISCRNLMIYLAAPLQARMLSIFHYALRDPGFLLLGGAETIHSFPGFAAFDVKARIYQRTSAAPRKALPDFSAPEPLPRGVLPTSRVAGAATPDVYREADRLVLAKFAPPGVIVSDDGAILQFRGQTGPYLEPVAGVASLELLRMVREELRLPVRKALSEARVSRRLARQSARLSNGPARDIVIEAIPFVAAATRQSCFVVLFRDLAAQTVEAATQSPAPVAASGEDSVRTSELQSELASTRDYLEAVIAQLETSNEELKAANEEVTSSNEELRSTNEELQMAKEELQATNEELRTLNGELSLRTEEATLLSNDLTNVLSSVEVPILLLGGDARLRRFTPAAARVFGLGELDVGRPLAASRSLAAASAELFAEVHARLQPVERTLRDDEGHWYQLTARPYLTLDRRVDGTVVTAFDIDELKRGGERLAGAQEYAEAIVDSLRECLLVLDDELRIRSANRAFYQVVEIAPESLIGHSVLELSQWDWDLVALRRWLEGLRTKDRVEGFRLNHAGSSPGSRTFLVSARRVEQTRFVLLVLDEVTERERAQQALERHDAEFREILTDAAEGILMIDATGQIVFANRAVTRLFGYAAAELSQLSVDALVPERLRASHASLRAAYLAAPSSRRMGPDRPLTGLRKDGTELAIEVTLSPIARPGGPRVICFIADATERRQAEQKIKDYQDQLRHMAFDAALAEERERRRIAVDLHDRIGQTLGLAHVKLRSARGVSPTAQPDIDEAIALLRQSIVDTRTLVFDLSPPILYDLGLAPALSWLAEELGKRSGLRIDVQSDEQTKPLDDATAALAFRAVRELLMNVVKHAETSSAKVNVRRTQDRIEIDVEDEGIGFDPSAVPPGGVGGGFGLFSVREQITRLGGSVELSSAPRQGTRVRLSLPVKLERASSFPPDAGSGAVAGPEVPR